MEQLCLSPSNTCPSIWERSHHCLCPLIPFMSPFFASDTPDCSSELLLGPENRFIRRERIPFCLLLLILERLRGLDFHEGILKLSQSGEPAQRLSQLPRVTQLIGSRTGFEATVCVDSKCIPL